MRLSRRTFLCSLTALPLVQADVRVASHSIGLELYSLRQDMARDLPGTLEVVHKLGFTHVEVPQLYRLPARELRKKLDSVGLACSAMVANDDALKPGTQQAIEDAHALGARYVIYPWIPHSSKIFQADDCQRAIQNFNTWGGQFKKAGLDFCYHPHGYEFGKSSDGTLLDTLIGGTDQDTVHYQMDTFWIAWPGQDPVAYLKKYPNRFKLLHLKDLRKGAQGNQTGNAPESDSVALGTGSIDFPAVLAAAKKAGVKGYYIEDESLTARQQIAESLRYLASLRNLN